MQQKKHLKSVLWCIVALIIRNKQTIKEAILIKSKIKVTNYKTDGCFLKASVFRIWVAIIVFIINMMNWTLLKLYEIRCRVSFALLLFYVSCSLIVMIFDPWLCVKLQTYKKSIKHCIINMKITFWKWTSGKALMEMMKCMLRFCWIELRCFMS